MVDGDIIVRGGIAIAKRPDGQAAEMPLADLLLALAPPKIDSCGIRLPQEVRFTYTRQHLTVLACEYPPGPYTLSWITDDSPAPFGPEAVYEKVTLSLPYVIVLAVYEGNNLTSLNECFFRRQPLTDVDEENELLFPGLYNCSRFMPPEGRPLSWICTQKLDRGLIRQEKDPRKRFAAGLTALRKCLFEQSFNLSSDHNEYSSWYSESRGLDQRISTARRWRDETVKDRFMGLDIPWLPTKHTLKSLVDRIYQNHGISSRSTISAQQLARIIHNNDKKQ